MNGIDLPMATSWNLNQFLKPPAPPAPKPETTLNIKTGAAVPVNPNEVHTFIENAQVDHSEPQVVQKIIAAFNPGLGIRSPALYTGSATAAEYSVDLPNGVPVAPAKNNHGLVIACAVIAAAAFYLHKKGKI